MKSFRIIFLIALITFISLGYVHSEIEIIKLGYTVKSNHIKLSKLIDQNRILMYNVSSLKSPSYLEKALIAKNTDYYLPTQTIIVKEKQNKPKGSMLAGSKFFKNRLANLFEPKKAAQAEEKK